jgi:hypothetical protein
MNQIPPYLIVRSMAETMARDVASSSTTKIWISKMGFLVVQDWPTLTLSPSMLSLYRKTMGNREVYLY